VAQPISETLANLNLDLALQQFLQVKHTRLEGLVIEYEIDQTFVPYLTAKGWGFFDCLITYRQGRSREGEFVVLDRGSAQVDQVRSLLSGIGVPVRELRVDQSRVMLLDDSAGRRLATPIELHPGAGQRTASSSINDRRIKAMFWGFGAHLGERFVQSARELLIKDYYLSDGYYLWDIDGLCVAPSGERFVLEAKHKYPFVRNGQLFFGMNVGEVRQIEMLRTGGWRPVHLILVKPRWDKSVSSMYLFFDRAARERALWIAAHLASPEGEIRIADASTSIYAAGGVPFHELRVKDFKLLGTNGDYSDLLGANLEAFLMEPHSALEVNAEMLLSRRIR
jgi:hypothetical protein